MNEEALFARVPKKNAPKNRECKSVCFQAVFPSSRVGLDVIRDRNPLCYVLHVHIYSRRLKPLTHFLLGTGPEINNEPV